MPRVERLRPAPGNHQDRGRVAATDTYYDRLETGTTYRLNTKSRSTSSPPSTMDTYRTSRSSFPTTDSAVYPTPPNISDAVDTTCQPVCPQNILAVSADFSVPTRRNSSAASGRAAISS